jgi:hypothetical protein
MTSQTSKPMKTVTKTLFLFFLGVFTLQLTAQSDPEGIAQIVDLTVSAAPDEMQVRIDWGATNNEYDGFEIYRTSTLLGTWTEEEDNFSWIDSTGTPGIDYLYRVRPFVLENNHPVYGLDSTAALLMFPMVEAVTNLSTEVLTTENAIQLSWAHSFDYVTEFQIKRNGAIIDTIAHNEALTFVDATGMPGQLYQYSITALYGSFASESSIVQLNYPGVTAVENFSVTIPYEENVQLTDRLIDAGGPYAEEYTLNHTLLQWSYDTNRVDFFNIYRDGQLLCVVSPYESQFEDYHGLPGQENVTYAVTAVIERQGTRFESEPIVKEVVFPSLINPYKVKSTSMDDEGNMRIQFTYNCYGADGFYIFRGSSESNLMPIDTIYDNTYSIDAKSYFDETGTPGVGYFYGVQAFSVRHSVEYLSSIQMPYIPEYYPRPPMVDSLEASDGTFFNYVALNWTYDEGINYDGFQLLRKKTDSDNWIVIASLAKGKRQFKDIFNEFTEDATRYDYQIKPFRVAEGNCYYASPVYDNGYAQNQIGVYKNKIYASDASAESKFGQALAVDDDRAIVGAPQYTVNGVARVGAIYFYKEENGTWIQESLFLNESGEENDQLGFKVDISGDWAIVGGGNRANYSGEAVIFHRTENGWEKFQHLLPNTDESQRFGRAVAIDGEYAIVGAFRDDTRGEDAGAAFLYHWDSTSESWELEKRLLPAILQHEEIGELSGEFGYAVDIQVDTDNPGGEQDVVYAVVGEWKEDRYATKGGAVSIYKKEDGEWSREQKLYGKYGTIYLNNLQFGKRVAIDGDYLVVSSDQISTPNSPHFSRIQIFEKDENDDWQEEAFFMGSMAYYYGNNVDISGNKVIVSCSGCDFNGSNSGGAYVYSRSGGEWSYDRTLKAFDGTHDDKFAVDVAISGDNIVVGAFMDDDQGSNSGSVYWFDQLPMVEEVTASDAGQATENPCNSIAGISPQNVLVAWEISVEDQKDITGFKVFREDIQLAVVSKAADGTTCYTLSDIFSSPTVDQIPGQEYLYKVVTYKGNRASSPVADLGSVMASGKISGKVMTAAGNSPVPDVNITAKGTVDGAYFTYTTTTDEQGEFKFEEVQYSLEEADYTLTASYFNHKFNPASQEVSLSLDGTSANSIIFLDTTAYEVKGEVAYEWLDCGLENARVTAVSTFEDDIETVAETFTDKNGQYSLIINPNAAGLQSIHIKIDSFRVFGEIGNQDTIYHQFDQYSKDLGTLSMIPQTKVINFNDQLTYDIELNVQDACGSPISSDHYEIRIRSEDQCYDELFTTDTLGEVTASLPPMDFTINVVGVDDGATETEEIVDFLKYRPANLALTAVQHAEGAALNTIVLDPILLTYHNTPEVNITGFYRYLCDDNANSAIIEQDVKYTLNIDVIEMHNNSCHVQEGYLKITNPAALNTEPVVMELNAETNTFPAYQFIGGSPNLANPYAWSMVIEYFSPNDDFLGSTTQGIIVEGYSEIPGNDIIVDMGQDEPIPFPLYILRDPMGDGSYSYIAEGTTISKSIAIAQEEDGSAAYVLKTVGKVVGVGTELNLEIGIGGNGSQARSWDFEMTTNKTLTTSDALDMVGRKADVIVGVGMAMQYGYVQELRVDENCDIHTTYQLGFTPNSVETTWAYTVGYIEGLIEDYQQDLVEIENGELDYYKSDGSAFTDEEATDLINSYIDNWAQVLHYHDVETLPHYLLCTAPINEGLPDGNKDEINEWKEAFCSMIGQEVNGEFELNDVVEWNEGLINAYNATATAIRNLSDENLGLDAALVWQYGDDAFSGTSAYVDAQYNAAYGILAENITFSGGVEFSSSISGAQASTKNFQSGFYLDSSTETLVGIEDETIVFIGLGGGTIKKITEFGFQTGMATRFSYEITEAKETTEASTIEVGYTFYDDDENDHFSVTVVQGVSQSHTPYFSLLGGRSSCPPEAGSMLINDVDFKLLDGTSASYAMSMHDVPADEPAIFQMQLINESPFGDTLDLIAFIAANDHNANITLEGGVEVAGGYAYNNVPPNADHPLELELIIEQGDFYYNHDNITIGLKPNCGEGTGGSDETIYITVSVNFLEPCTPISISDPIDNWSVNSLDHSLAVELSDYDLNNSTFEFLEMKYRRLEGENEWNVIDIIDSLGEEKTIFNWNLEDDLLDGTYEIRAMVVCHNGETYSEVVSGIIDRTLPVAMDYQLIEILSANGDGITVNFSEDIDCPAILEGQVDVVLESTGQSILASLICNDNKLTLVLDEPFDGYEGDTLTLHLAGIPDLFGNPSASITASIPINQEVTPFAVPIQEEKQDKLMVRSTESDQSATTTTVRNNTVSPAASKCSAYPNPFGDELNVLMLAPTAGRYQLLLRNLNGQVLQTLEVKAVNGINRIAIPLADQRLVPGIYLIDIRSGQFNTTLKVVKV